MYIEVLFHFWTMSKDDLPRLHVNVTKDLITDFVNKMFLVIH